VANLVHHIELFIPKKVYERLEIQFQRLSAQRKIDCTFRELLTSMLEGSVGIMEWEAQHDNLVQTPDMIRATREVSEAQVDEWSKRLQEIKKNG